MSELLSKHPRPRTIIGQSHLIKLAFSGCDLRPLLHTLLDSSDNDHLDCGAALDVSTILTLMHRPEEAAEIQIAALQQEQHFSLRKEAEKDPIYVLAIVTSGDFMANTPVEFLIAPERFHLDYLYVLPGREIGSLPDHDIAIICVAYSRENEPLLVQLNTAVASWSQPVINMPANVLQTSRDGLASALRDSEGVLAPQVRAVSRSEFINRESLPAEMVYPILIRPVDSHAGNDLQKIDGVGDLKHYMERAKTDSFFLSQFYDYRSPDGLFRKLRVAFVEGRPFLCHLAVRDHWMIHYLNAGMLESAEKRKMEEAAMADFDERFVPRHRRALEEIYARVGLDYFVADCGEMPDGRLIVFEADTAMIVHDMDSPDIFPYKPPQMRRVFSAFQEMLLARVSEALAEFD